MGLMYLSFHHHPESATHPCFPMCIPLPFAARSAKGPLSSHHVSTGEKIPRSSHQPWFLRSLMLQRLPNAAITCLGPGMQPPTHAGQDLLQAAAVASIPTERKGHRPRLTELAAPQETDTALSCSRHLPEHPQLGPVSPPFGMGLVMHTRQRRSASTDHRQQRGMQNRNTCT